MATEEIKQAVSGEHRLTKVEIDLAQHIRVCERDGRETKYWVRLIGGALILYVIKQLLGIHTPLG